MNPVTFNCTVLRDGHQSLAATRMKTADMLPIAPILDSMGFSALETWGGATIDAGLRFLKEWPFDRLDALKKAAPKTPHMMLLRGQNIVGYTNYADDVVEAFVAMSAKHGMNIFRIFDCVNDPRNMETSIRAAKKAGAQAHGTICYTTSPVHTTQTFVDMGRELADMGADAIVIKDMAGLIPPYVTQELVSALKKDLNIPVWIHTHDTAGLGASTYLSAIDAGVDACDVSISSHRNEVVDSDTLRYQVPGGMLSNFRTQLKEQGMEDKFEEVFAEIPVVRKALGWIPLVTPTSQIVGVQAMLNVKFGRWKNITPQAADIALGYYGRTSAPVDPEVQKLCAEKMGKHPITCRPADLIKPGMEDLRKKLAEKGLPTDDEHCVIYAMFPQQVEDFYKKPEPKEEAPVQVNTAPAAAPASAAPSMTVIDNGITARVSGPSGSRDLTIIINGQSHSVKVERIG